jgi:hypothetical protein
MSDMQEIAKTIETMLSPGEHYVIVVTTGKVSRGRMVCDSRIATDLSIYNASAVLNGVVQAAEQNLPETEVLYVTPVREVLAQ